MHIAVDGYNIMMPRGTGVATYGRSFIAAALGLGHSVSLLAGDDVLDQPHGGRPGQGSRLRKITDFVQSPFGLRVRPVPMHALPEGGRAALPDIDALWNRARLFRGAKGYYRRTGRFVPVRMDNVDVVHWTYPLPLYVPGARNIYTIHDVVPLKFPEMVRNAEEFATLCRDVASHADQIWTVSETSRADIIELLGLDAAIVFNSYQPVDLAAADAERDDVLAMHGLRAGGYFLFYGAIEPKKNVLRLLDAHARARVDTPLVVVGKAGWQCDEEMRRLKAGVVGEGPAGRPRLLWLDYLPRAQLLHLVAKAKAVLFPSLYEGFGLPMLEAMTLGTPVLGSTGGSLPEVAGDAALLVDPLSVEALSKAIHRLDGDAVLRARLAHDGPKRALVFSADRYRERVGALLQILQGATIPLRDPPVRR